jgi:transcription elongation regulator 1
MPTFANVNAASAAPAAPKKDKPLVKTPIPDTDWIRVKTVQGNVFYNNKATKASVWIIPEEIREEVQALEAEEAAAERQKQLDAEAARSKGAAAPKRKADTVAGAGAAAKKKLKTGSGDEEEGSEESEEEDWQREAAAQLAAEAEAMEKLKKEEKEMLAESARQAEREMAEKAAKLNLPRREDLSIEEAKALFKVCCRDIALRTKAHISSRRYCKKRASTLSFPGTCRCLSLCQIPAMGC